MYQPTVSNLDHFKIEINTVEKMCKFDSQYQETGSREHPQF